VHRLRLVPNVISHVHQRASSQPYKSSSKISTSSSRCTTRGSLPTALTSLPIRPMSSERSRRGWTCEFISLVPR
jgi:hypothetical protein